MQDTREKLRYLLKACTGRYRRVRAAETVAVVMTAGACAAAIAQVAWSIAQVHPVAASAIAAAGAAVGIILPLGPIRKILAVPCRQAFLCAAVMCAVSIAAAACCLLGYTDAISRPALLAVSLLSAGLTGLLASYIFPPSQRQAAIDIDERCRLGERLSTAAELMENCESRIANRELNDNGADTRATLNAQRWGCDDGATTRAASVSASDTPTNQHLETQAGNRPKNEELLGNHVCRTLSQTTRQEHPTSDSDTCAETVFKQALRSADEKDILHAPLWRRTRATAGALGLAILLGMTLLLVPTFEPSGAAGSVGRDLAASLDEMSPQKKRQLVEAFLAASTQPAQPAEVRQALKDAGMAASNNDPKSLEDALAILDRAGYKLKSILPVSTTSGNTGTEPNTGQSPTTTSPTKPPTTPPADKASTDLVRVMNPDYKPIQAGTSQTPTDTNKTSPSQSSSQMLPWDTAWDIARARAANALAEGQVPPRYRQLVRDFFSADNANSDSFDSR